MEILYLMAIMVAASVLLLLVFSDPVSENDHEELL